MSLIKTAETVKKGIVVVVAFFVLYALILIVAAPVKTLFVTLFPPKDLPTVTYGMLDQIKFTEIPTLTPSPEYVLNTQTGGLPRDLPKTVKVYKYAPLRSSFSGGKKAQTDAATLGFTNEMRVTDLSAGIYVWQDPAYGGSLAIDVNTMELTLDTPVELTPENYPAGSLTRLTSTSRAKNILKKLGQFDDALYVSGSQKITFGEFKFGTLAKADAQREANVVKVDFFREIEGYPILGPNPEKGLLSVTMRAEEKFTKDELKQLDYPMAELHHWKVNPNSTATYPLIPVSLAWEQVQEGNGIVSNVTSGAANPFGNFVQTRTSRILINEVFIAYFDNEDPQTYLQPIYVFKGNYTNPGVSADEGDITIYYPAVSGEYVKTDQ